MKSIKRKLGTIALIAAIITVSCKSENNKEAKSNENQNVSTEVNVGKETANPNQDVTSETILNNYFDLKNALVNDDNENAKTYGKTFAKNIVAMDISNYSDSEKASLNEIIQEAKKNAQQIAESDIKNQRVHFKSLSKEMTAMLRITGTSNKIYEQYCPMYDGGTAWLSRSEDIKNPYYGSSMLTCGKVQREIL
ncbi:DUF3347 domain-containing protein [Galbibacter mesophilus]|uniref:DUF3347 domain-containing protein n=1 Tax=Galbibacter mesophilus TaxID=379069 RepID=UPI00191F94AC|nr:DUF3347 domain-containing protein [Galbibacter mesophilus]MCM5662762.1 DUF3347 domain-containing protein [Galbibacter mesophilus]